MIMNSNQLNLPYIYIINFMDCFIRVISMLFWIPAFCIFLYVGALNSSHVFKYTLYNINE